MYRRNISNILYPIAGLLGLIIVYQAVVKPAYQTPPPIPPDEHSPVDQRDPAPEEVYQAAPEESPTVPPKQLRVIDAGGVPDIKGHDILESIRDELEKGNLKSAETQLLLCDSGRLVRWRFIRCVKSLLFFL